MKEGREQGRGRGTGRLVLVLRKFKCQGVAADVNMKMIRVRYGHTEEHTRSSFISICWLQLQLAGISMYSHITHTPGMPGAAK